MESGVSFSKLVIIFPDRWSAAQVVADAHPHHFNPGCLFKEVHAIFMSEAALHVEELKRACGGAQVFTYTYPLTTKFHTSPLKWRPLLKKSRARKVLKLIRELRPDLVRSYGAGIDLYLANKVHRRLRIPYIVEVARNSYDFYRTRAALSSKKFKFWFSSRVHRVQEKLGLKQADAVICTAEGIMPQMRRMKIPKAHLIYNLIPQWRIMPKQSYDIGDKVKVLIWGPQTAFINPKNIIKACARIPYVQMDVVGYGDIYNELVDMVAEMGVGRRVNFLTAMPTQLSGYDLFAACCESIEIQQPVQIAMSSGLPVVINRRMGPPVPEFLPENIKLTENTENGYYFSILTVLEDDDLRRSLGINARKTADQKWHPDVVEAKQSDLIKRVMGERQNVRFIDFIRRRKRV